MTDGIESKQPASKRERTRARLVEAAGLILDESGYETLVLEDVAERSGVTRRTIYDHFRNKDELIFAVLYARRAQLFVPIKKGQTLRSYLRSLAKVLIDFTANDFGAGRSTASFEAYALKDEGMRQKILATTQESYPLMEAKLVEGFGQDAFAMPPAKFVRVLHALLMGILSRRYLVPEEFPPEVVYAAFDALAMSQMKT